MTPRMGKAVSTHAPLGLGERHRVRQRGLQLIVSTHAPLGLGERRAPSVEVEALPHGFNPRSPRPRGATKALRCVHSLGDFCFNPRSPRPRGATQLPGRVLEPDAFVSTHAPLGLGERLPQEPAFLTQPPVSTHAPLGLGERLGPKDSDLAAAGVSTHAPLGLGERRGTVRPAYHMRFEFQPTLPSASGSDVLFAPSLHLEGAVSTHAPLGLGERRRGVAWAEVVTGLFQPTLPSASGSDPTQRSRK